MKLTFHLIKSKYVFEKETALPNPQSLYLTDRTKKTHNKVRIVTLGFQLTFFFPLPLTPTVFLPFFLRDCLYISLYVYGDTFLFFKKFEKKMKDKYNFNEGRI